jgi:hypothetical protein
MAIEFEKKLGGQVLAETLIELINEGLDIVTIENDGLVLTDVSGGGSYCPL